MAVNKSFVFSQEFENNKTHKKEKLKQDLVEQFYTKGPLTIHDLCKTVKMSAPTITRMVEELIEQGMVIKTGIGDSSGGRRPGLYSINPSSYYAMAIDLERSFVKIAIFDFVNRPVSGIAEYNEGLDTLKDVPAFINDKINDLLEVNKISKEKILGIGLSLPGLIDIRTGLSYTYLNGQKPVAEVITKLTGITTYVEHDTKAMAWGEHTFGLAQGMQNVLCLNIGSGIGLSMILNGEIYNGHSGYSGEFGHIQIDSNGKLCHCGKRGCIETIAAGKSLIVKVKDDIRNGNAANFAHLVNIEPEQITISVILAAARDGNQYATGLLEQVGQALGRGIAVLVHLFNPELIILGGELSKASDFLMRPINENIEIHTIERIRKDARLVVSELGDNARIMGSLALVMNKTFA